MAEAIHRTSEGITNVLQAPLACLAKLYGMCQIQGLEFQEIVLSGSPEDLTQPIRAEVVFNVLPGKKKSNMGMCVKVVITFVLESSLPKTPFSTEGLSPPVFAVLAPLLKGNICTAPPPDVEFAEVVILYKGEFYLVRVIPEVTPECHRMMVLEEDMVKKKEDAEQVAALKRAKKAEALALANEEARLAEELVCLRRKQEQFEKLSALRCQAFLRDFPTVEAMLAADAAAELRCKVVAQEEQKSMERQEEQKQAAVLAEEARKRKALREAEAAAAHKAKYGSKKGSPPQSRSASVTPPLP